MAHVHRTTTARELIHEARQHIRVANIAECALDATNAPFKAIRRDSPVGELAMRLQDASATHIEEAEGLLYNAARIIRERNPERAARLERMIESKPDLYVYGRTIHLK